MKPLPSSAKKGRGLPASSSGLEPNVYPSSSGRITNREQNVYVPSIRRDHCASPPLYSFHLLASKIGIFRLRSGIPISPPCSLSGGLSSREGAFPGYLLLWSTRSPGIRFRFYAIASKMFCVCVRSSPRSARTFFTRSDSACLCAPNELPYRPLVCDFSTHTDKPALGLALLRCASPLGRLPLR